MLPCGDYGTDLRSDWKKHADWRAVLQPYPRDAIQPDRQVRRKANLQKRRIYVPELGKTVIIDVSVEGLRIIKKNGAYAALKKARVI